LSSPVVRSRGMVLDYRAHAAAISVAACGNLSFGV
jgi:hypothetical protein